MLGSGSLAEAEKPKSLLSEDVDMKRQMLLVLAWSALHGSVALAANCTNETLKGTVVASVSKSTAAGPTSSLFMESWDGAGHVQYLESDSNGTQTNTYYGTATYSISPDCVATVYYDGATAQPFNYYVDADGEGYFWVNNQNVGVIAAGHTDLISKELIVNPTATTPGPCSLATLKGTMAYEVEKTLQGLPRASDGMESYDGAGHLNYRETDTDGYTTTSYPGTGTYTITDRCVASVYYDGSTTPFVFFVAPNGSAYWWINNQNSGIVAAGKALRVSRELVVK